jgi:hypothetical protein
MYNEGMVRTSSQQASIQAPATQPARLSGEERKELLEQRKLFIDLQNQVTQSFDKMIGAIAGGHSLSPSPLFGKPCQQRCRELRSIWPLPGSFFSLPCHQTRRAEGHGSPRRGSDICAPPGTTSESAARSCSTAEASKASEA